MIITRLFSAVSAAWLLVWLCGCHSEPVLNTASGRPEVIIRGKSAEQILAAGKDFFVHRGYVSKPTDNRYKVSFDRHTEKPGGKASASICLRVQLMVVDLNDGSFRLTGIPTRVEDCGAELEAEHVMPVAYPQIQSLLWEIKAQLDSTR